MKSDIILQVNEKPNFNPRKNHLIIVTQSYELTMPGGSTLRILVLDTIESAFLSGFVPVVGPVTRADAESVLPVSLALIIVTTSLLKTDDPFIVTIPAVKSLVCRRESLITRSGASILDLVQQVLLLFRESRDLVTENLVQLHRNNWKI